MTDIETHLLRPEAMTSVVMDSRKSYDLEDSNGSSTYPEVQMRQKNAVDASETQRKKRAKNRLSNRRSTGYVYDAQIEAALKMGPVVHSSGTANQ